MPTKPPADVVPEQGLPVVLPAESGLSHHGPIQPPTNNIRNVPAPVDQIVEFVVRLFGPGDQVTVRMIESWQGEGKNHSRVLQVLHLALTSSDKGSENHLALKHKLAAIVHAADCSGANVYFGVCPRVNRDRQRTVDIRTVRAFWADLDEVLPDEAMARCRKAGLPEPSFVVGSGHGAHCYWLLRESYSIDDASSSSNQNTRGGSQHNPGPLSSKARYAQRILSGIANAIGGDHTHDLARLLRLPGTTNRKNQRNGQSPVPCELVSFQPEMRYALSDFEPFAQPSPESDGCAPQVDLPKRKTPTPSVIKRFNRRLRECAEARNKMRSERDFALCCFAVREKIPRKWVWRRVRTVGKFAERGEPYFLVTWRNAKHEVLQQAAAGGSDRLLPRLVIDEGRPLAQTFRELTSYLLASGDHYFFARRLCRIANEEALLIRTADELAGALAGHVEVTVIKQAGGQTRSAFRPLPRNYGSAYLKSREPARFPGIDMFAKAPLYDDDWTVSEPGYNPRCKAYYVGSIVTPAEGTQHIDALLAEFCFRDQADRANMIALMLDTLLRGQFRGARPVGLLNGNQPELGKSSLAQTLAVLRESSDTETVTYTSNDEELEKRLAARVKTGTSLIILDNAKGDKGTKLVESAVLERCTTDPILSFRRLGTNSEIVAANTLLFLVTINGAQLSPDLAARTIPVNLYFEGAPRQRRFSHADPIRHARDRRTELLAELVGMVELWKAAGRPIDQVDSRFRPWAGTVGGILRVSNIDGFLANLGGTMRDYDPNYPDVEELMHLLAGQPGASAGTLVEICNEQGLLRDARGTTSAKSQAMKLGRFLGRYLREVFQVRSADGRMCSVQFDSVVDSHTKQRVYVVLSLS